MEFTEPKVFHVAQTTSDDEGLAAYLAEIGAPEWKTDAATGAETLIEVMGRGCYNSYAVGLNPNVTRVREGSADYLANIIKSGHGSVLEHATDSYMIFCSRACTHQLVRTRVGVAYSQASLHFIRIDALKSWFPAVFEGHPRVDAIRALYKAKFEDLEIAQLELADLLDIDKQTFHDKKKLTAAMRRLAPIGLHTMLGITANHRTFRWLIEQRSSRFNDEEIRLVAALLFREQHRRYPALYADALVESVEGFDEITFEKQKV
jgi:thymidylate synthase (FAD)